MTRKSRLKPSSNSASASKNSRQNGRLAVEKSGSAKKARQTTARASKGTGRATGGELPVISWVAAAIDSAKQPLARPGLRVGDRNGRVLIVPVAHAGLSNEAREWLLGHLEGVPSWQRDSAIKSLPDSMMLVDDAGPLWVLMPRCESATASQGGAFLPSAYGRTRDLIGACVQGFRDYKLKRLSISGFECTRDHWLGALTGLDIGAYRFVELQQKQGAGCLLPAITLPTEVSRDPGLIREAAARARGVNVARHLVNLPPNELHPGRYAEIVASLFAGSRSMKVEILREKDLEREQMGLLLGVGAGSNQPPCLVHMKYRPVLKTHRRGKTVAPVAFIGKGITFDTGGLDIKPSSGMRWMKKDMGGSAATVGLAVWVEEMALDRPVDFYLAIAENAVSSNSMRPGDILRARNGMTVEIHNTDAEGRLVLADAIDYAVTRPGADEPALLVDTSTLTGAMRVAVGLTISGMFASSDSLAGACIGAGQRAGDPCWRLPLFQEYKSALKSHAADMTNCSDSSFGGAITAALFLEKFTRGKPWIHFDFYGWVDRPRGAISEPGGNGQSVQLLVELLSRNLLMENL